MRIQDVRVGQRVVLPANEKEGWKEERGKVESVHAPSRTIVVRVDARFVQQGTAEHDDGLRECLPRYVRLEKRRSK